MKFRVTRTSLSSTECPIEGAKLELVPFVEGKDKVRLPSDWFSVGENHHTKEENGRTFYYRTVKKEAWVIDSDSIELIMNLNDYVILKRMEDMFFQIPEIEIYDTYRE